MKRMNAIQVNERGDLRWAETETPPVGRDEVLVEVRATAVNRADLLQRIGRYPPPPGASEILGLEAAGRIVRLGEGAQAAGWSVGDRVCALLPGGGYAEYVACDKGVLLRVGDGLDLVEAAALPEVLYTAFLNLFLEAGLRPGERVLVHAGASGVGTMAIQLCRAHGSPVYATASRDKLARLAALGAEAIDRRAEDLVDRVRALTDGQGVDVILDPVGGEHLQRNIELLRRGGRLVVIGLLGGHRAELSLAPLLTGNLRLIGSVLRSRSNQEKAGITRAIEQRVWPLVAAGQIVPVIDSTCPITEAAAAHERMRANANVGKIVLVVE